MPTKSIAALIHDAQRAVSRRSSLRAMLAAAIIAEPHSFFPADEALGRKRRRKLKKRCKGGTTKCGKQCFALASDGANCGACGNACALDLCFHGACVCVTSDDCAEGCVCKPSVQGAFACASNATEVLCVTDDDCPVGSFCLDSKIPNIPRTCTVACLG